MRSPVNLNRELIEQLDIQGPRYTSYPTAVEWKTSFTEKDYIQHLTKAPCLPLSLYVHIPFCESQCYFCGCNTVIRKSKQNFAMTYLEYVKKEIESVSLRLGQKRQVKQLHLGGGTPNFLRETELSFLMDTHYIVGTGKKLGN